MRRRGPAAPQAGRAPSLRQILLTLKAVIIQAGLNVIEIGRDKVSFIVGALDRDLAAFCRRRI
jgi:hypothetical protein